MKRSLTGEVLIVIVGALGLRLELDLECGVEAVSWPVLSVMFRPPPSDRTTLAPDVDERKSLSHSLVVRILHFSTHGS